MWETVLRVWNAKLSACVTSTEVIFMTEHFISSEELLRKLDVEMQRWICLLHQELHLVVQNFFVHSKPALYHSKHVWGRTEDAEHWPDRVTEDQAGIWSAAQTQCSCIGFAIDKVPWAYRHCICSTVCCIRLVSWCIMYIVKHSLSNLLGLGRSWSCRTVHWESQEVSEIRHEGSEFIFGKSG